MPNRVGNGKAATCVEKSWQWERWALVMGASNGRERSGRGVCCAAQRLRDSEPGESGAVVSARQFDRETASETCAADWERRELSASLDIESGRLGPQRFGAVRAVDERSTERVVRARRRPTRRQRPQRGAKILRRRYASRGPLNRRCSSSRLGLQVPREQVHPVCVFRLLRLRDEFVEQAGDEPAGQLL